jgi:serine/threonine-protein kinase
LGLYLVFVIIVSLVVGWLVLKLKLPSPRLVIALVLLFILSPLIIGYFYLIYFNSLPETLVPAVTGLPLEAAREKLESANLKARLAGSVYAFKDPQGTVVAQRPEGNRRVKVGRVVNLIISSGQSKVTVPNLIGRTFSQADTVLSAAELQMGDVRTEYNPNLEEKTILAQEPLGGEEVEIGSRVELLISTTLEATP